MGGNWAWMGMHEGNSAKQINQVSRRASHHAIFRVRGCVVRSLSLQGGLTGGEAKMGVMVIVIVIIPQYLEPRDKGRGRCVS